MTFSRYVFQQLPECIFEADARLVACDDGGALDDRRSHVRCLWMCVADGCVPTMRHDAEQSIPDYRISQHSSFAARVPPRSSRCICVLRSATRTSSVVVPYYPKSEAACPRRVGHRSGGGRSEVLAHRCGDAVRLDAELPGRASAPGRFVGPYIHQFQIALTPDV